MEDKAIKVDLEIRLDADRNIVERDTQFTLVGNDLTEKAINRRGVM